MWGSPEAIGKSKLDARGEIGLDYNWAASWLIGLFASSGMYELVWGEKIAFRREVEAWIGAHGDGEVNGWAV